MKTIKYFYSDAVQLRSLKVLTDAKGDVIGIIPSEPELIKDLPRVTVCSMYDEKEQKVYYGVTTCSSKDHFSRKVAREISLKRAKTSPSRIAIVKNTKFLGTTSKRIVKEIFDAKLAKVKKLCEV